MNAPRYWDGRVRRVVSVDSKRSGGGDVVRVEVLECGHVKAPVFSGQFSTASTRVCWACPGVER